MVTIFADQEPAWRCTVLSGCDATARSVCTWARTGLVGVGRRLGKLDGGGVGVGLWREVQGWACPGLVLNLAATC
ncbi:hypothetical protein FH972_008047 [Carpinus fangiana]|uniref:Uncharacterized protein n=1 Tax=Carpinus fangiana TaxID=176857 RepID=A0A5N6QZ29_9ROSI|nr:hypothetical protein FH972_008047 [Carpinus fangiana]